jgi:uncharacterized paraquat-inducible protein A
MTRLFDDQPSPTKTPRDVPTTRACLRCKAVFQSEGFGERICPRCKGSSVWKSAPPTRGDGTRQR